MKLGFQFTRHTRLVVGYDFLYWSKVARAGEQIDRTVNSTLVPELTASPRRGIRPTPSLPSRRPDSGPRASMSAWIAGGNEFAAPFQPMDIGKEPTASVGQGASACLPIRKSLLRGSPVLAALVGRKRRGASSGQNRRGLRFESLETRSLLSATVLPRSAASSTRTRPAAY